jgi:hypothetical protein
MGAPASADVVEVSVLEWGPLMPLDDGASGHMLLNVGPTAKLDAHLVSVDVVNTERRSVDTTIDGKRASAKMDYYFVRIRFDRAGFEKLVQIKKSVAEKSKAPESNGHSIHTSIRIAGDTQGERIVLDHKTKTAELRLVLFEKQLMPLLRAPRKPWKATKSKSTINRWVDGDIEIEPAGQFQK